MKEKQNILIVDDSELNRELLMEILGDEYGFIQAEDGVQAVELLRERSDFDLILLDVRMPRMDGFGVMEIMNQYHWIEDVPVIMISAEDVESFIERAYDLGASDYIRRPFDARVVQRRVSNTLMLYAKQRRLKNMVAEQIYEKEKSSDLMISILSHIVEFRNGESGQHVLHIRTITDLLLRELTRKTKRYNLSEQDIALICTASALHDIGKINIPEEILNKPGRLTAEEYAIMKTHTTIGASILGDLPVNQKEPLVQAAYEICRWHHERWDGGGYPDGLKGESIPISAQVVSLADVYDALTSERCYKKAFDHDTALRMIRNGECGAFNPLLLECLVEMSETIRQTMQHDSTVEYNYKREARRLADEALSKEEPEWSDRPHRMLALEKTRTEFFASHCVGLQFEYDDLSGKFHVPAFFAVAPPAQDGLPARQARRDDIQKAEHARAQREAEQPHDPICEIQQRGHTPFGLQNRSHPRGKRRITGHSVPKSSQGVVTCHAAADGRPRTSRGCLRHGMDQIIGAGDRPTGRLGSISNGERPFGVDEALDAVALLRGLEHPELAGGLAQQHHFLIHLFRHPSLVGGVGKGRPRSVCFRGGGLQCDAHRFGVAERDVRVRPDHHCKHARRDEHDRQQDDTQHRQPVAHRAVFDRRGVFPAFGDFRHD